MLRGVLRGIISPARQVAEMVVKAGRLELRATPLAGANDQAGSDASKEPRGSAFAVGSMEFGVVPGPGWPNPTATDIRGDALIHRGSKRADDLGACSRPPGIQSVFELDSRISFGGFDTSDISS